MVEQDFMALLPYLVMTGGLLVQLLVTSFHRGRATACITSLLVLIASLVAVPLGLQAGPTVVSGFVVLDGFTGFFNGLFIFAGIVTVVLADRYVRGRAGEPEEFFILVVSATLGAMVLGAAHHFAAVLLGLEILSISLYVLVGYPEEGHAPLEAALKYLVLSGVASTTMLFGMALIYNATGTLQLSELSAATPEVERFAVHLRIGQTMLFAGLAFKLSLVPFHMWTPDVYQGAPAPVTGYLATVSKGAVFAFAIRYVMDARALDDTTIYVVVSVLAVLSMVVGNVLALLQQSVKRILGYSSIAHLGYLLIALLVVAAVADRRLAAEAAMVYLACYFVMTLAAFAVISTLSSAFSDGDADDLDDYQGLFWRRPIAAAVLSVAMLSLAGLPATVGFIAKFYLISAGIDGALWLLVWALVIGSAVAIYYYLRVILVMTRAVTSTPYSHPQRNATSVSLLVVLGTTMIVFGIYPAPLIQIVRSALGF